MIDMIRLKHAVLFLSFALAGLFSAVAAHADGNGSGKGEFMYAMELYGNRMYGEAMSLFGSLSEKSGNEDAQAYYVLCAVHLRLPGYKEMIGDFITACPSSGMIPQIRLAYALALFDEKDFQGASEQFEMLSRHHVYRKQVPEFLFKGRSVGNAS